jgi:hypothetical protein
MADIAAFYSLICVLAGLLGLMAMVVQLVLALLIKLGL